MTLVLFCNKTFTRRARSETRCNDRDSKGLINRCCRRTPQTGTSGGPDTVGPGSLAPPDQIRGESSGSFAPIHLVRSDHRQ